MYLVTSHEMPIPSHMNGAKTPLLQRLTTANVVTYMVTISIFTDQIFGKRTEIPLKKFRVNYNYFSRPHQLKLM